MMSSVPLPVAHIARNMGLSRQNVQRLTNELEAQGVIRFAPNPRRAKLVLPTKQGRLLYEFVTAPEAMGERSGGWLTYQEHRSRD
jgi:DNA-binding MarR family transcriptional regulator